MENLLTDEQWLSIWPADRAILLMATHVLTAIDEANFHGEERGITSVAFHYVYASEILFANFFFWKGWGECTISQQFQFTPTFTT